MVKELPPSPGSRAERSMQLLCPELHAVESREDAVAMPPPATEPGWGERVGKLEADVTRLREIVRKLASSLGEADPFPDQDSAAI